MFKKLLSYQFLLATLIMAHTSCGQHTKTPWGQGLWTVDISHDDKYIALGGDDSLLRIFTIDVKPYKTIEAGGMIRAVHWNPKENLSAEKISSPYLKMINPATTLKMTAPASHKPVDVNTIFLNIKVSLAFFDHVYNFF